MKNRVQQELRKEYQARKTEFASYADFLNATADESEDIRCFREKVAKAKTATK